MKKLIKKNNHAGVWELGLLYKNSFNQGLEVLSCKGDQHFRPHLHDGYVLWLNSESSEHYDLKGGSHTLETGSISIIEPGIIHANRPSNKKKRHLRSFYLSEKFLSCLSQKLCGEFRDDLGFSTVVLKNSNLWKKFLLLHEKHLYEHSPLELESDTVLVFADLLHAFQNEKFLDRQTDTSEERVDRTIDYFHANIKKNITLNELSSINNCTTYHLIRLFRQKKGLSPHAYLVQLRLEHARKRLLSGQSIVDAALESGFSDQSHLSRRFKERYGLTPGQYLTQNLS
nr:AraC family transcriptional regulator [uncultured Desulfobacter sp.]